MMAWKDIVEVGRKKSVVNALFYSSIGKALHCEASVA